MRALSILAFGAAAAALLSGCNKDKAENTPAPPSLEASDAASAASEAAAELTSSLSSESKTFRDWIAVCDNINNCAAFGPAEGSGGFVMVKLAAGPAARPAVYLASWNLGDGSGPFSATIDGQVYNGRNEGANAENPYLKIDNPSDQLLRGISQGTDMRIHAGSQSTSVSLSGAAAAFLWIDERQGRLGTTTALIRRGDRPASAVPAAPAAPRLQVAAAVPQNNLPQAASLPRALTNMESVKACQSEFVSGGTSDDNTVSRLGPDQLMWQIPCGSGAYNFSQAYFITRNDGSSPRQISFPSSGQPQDILTNSRYDPATRTMSAFGKGRGIGDCGVMGEWVWTGENFTMKDEIAMTECLGIPWDIWPSTWKTAR